MSYLTVLLALLAALSNASASVLQRRAATEEPEGGAGVRQAVRWLARVLRRPHWLAGAGLLALSTVLQAFALAVGSLSVVQPLLATELLFTLAVGSLVFRRRPNGRTWLAFAALAIGLAVFLGAAQPSAGRSTAPAERWLMAGGAVLGLAALLVVAARPVKARPARRCSGCRPPCPSPPPRLSSRRSWDGSPRIRAPFWPSGRRMPPSASGRWPSSCCRARCAPAP